MLADINSEAQKYELEVHHDNTKILWNGRGRGTNARTVRVAHKEFDVLKPSATTDCLGRLFSFTDTHDVELDNRLSKAWKTFAVFKEELTDKSYPLGQRLKLFRSVVQSRI